MKTELEPTKALTFDLFGTVLETLDTLLTAQDLFAMNWTESCVNTATTLRFV